MSILGAENPVDDIYYATLQANWEDRSNCCCNVAYFPEQDFKMIGHWNASLLKPLLISFFGILSLLNLVYDIYMSANDIYVLISLELVALFVFFSLALSYWILIIRGPGYVPYNWDLTQQKHYTWSTQMSSMAIYQEQVKYARMAVRPPRSSFSVGARRYVLRADHYCYWTNSWVGFKNQRYFILFTMWTVIYGLCWIGLRYRWYLVAFIPFHWQSIISLVMFPFILYVIGFAFHHFRHGIVNVIHNTTVIEKYHKRNVDDFNRGFCGNLEEVCGPRACCCFWPCPWVCLNPVGDGFYSHHDFM